MFVTTSAKSAGRGFAAALAAWAASGSSAQMAKPACRWHPGHLRGHWTQVKVLLWKELVLEMPRNALSQRAEALEHVQKEASLAVSTELHRAHLQSSDLAPALGNPDQPRTGAETSAPLISRGPFPPAMHLEQTVPASLVCGVNLTSLHLGLTSGEGGANCLHVSTLPIPTL